MQLGIKVNSVPLELGKPADIKALEKAHFQKPGPLRRLFKQPPPGQTLFRAHNCQVDCFNDGFTLYPCTHRYLNDDRQWETHARVYLVDGRVRKLEFQVIEGHYAAANFLERFQNACKGVLGEPLEHSRYRTFWRKGTSEVTSNLHEDMINVDFLVEYIGV